MITITPSDLRRMTEEAISSAKRELSAKKDQIFRSAMQQLKADVTAGRNFSVLVVKTNMVLPYTSVFIELRASYWSDEAEQRLRQLIHP